MISLVFELCWVFRSWMRIRICHNFPALCRQGVKASMICTCVSSSRQISNGGIIETLTPHNQTVPKQSVSDDESPTSDNATET